MSRSFLAVGLLLLVGCAQPRSNEAAAPAAAPPAEKAAFTKPSDAELKARLTPLQFEVTQHAATEPPFRNAYWDNHADGIYVDVVSGVPLFSSRDKFESGTGWPSFTKPIAAGVVTEKTDGTLGMERTEVLSTTAGSHLGHVFDDGPAPTHRRYCMNSASLRFVPAAELAAKGYAPYAASFGTSAAAVPAATNNACAFPPPGAKAGCQTTLAVAVLSAADVPRFPGVLEVVRGHAGAKPAVSVTFDPAQVTLDELAGASHADVVADAASFRQD